MAKILVVDDDKLIRDGLSEMLRSEQYEVVTATNGNEGLELAIKEELDLIITDVLMPEMSGLDMINEIRKDKRGKKLPIIVLSNDESTSSINTVLKEGVTVYLAKSGFEPRSMIEQIKVALGH